jgi:hypothetical protein
MMMRIQGTIVFVVILASIGTIRPVHIGIIRPVLALFAQYWHLFAHAYCFDSGIAHAFRIIRHSTCEVSVTGILDYPCISHLIRALPMHFALSGIANAFRIIRHRPCISHYQALPMHFAL